MTQVSRVAGPNFKSRGAKFEESGVHGGGFQESRGQVSRIKCPRGQVSKAAGPSFKSRGEVSLGPSCNNHLIEFQESRGQASGVQCPGSQASRVAGPGCKSRGRDWNHNPVHRY